MNEERKNEEATEHNEEHSGSISADLIRGHINTIILRTLYERDKYGYEIIEEIDSKSHGQYSLKQPTLYSALKRLESQGYITAYWKTDEVSQGGRRKYYTLTESGRKITEKNQAEWEYSRTVIDNLISDRSFDFSQPAPTPVDFKILKSSTSRVPLVKIENEKEETEERISIETETITKESKPEFEEPKLNIVENEPKQSDEDRKRIHENYLKLISEPIATPKETQQTPYSESIDTEKLIYNNRPEPERDYKNLINGLFDRTVKTPRNSPVATEKIAPTATSAVRVNYEDIGIKAEHDGLKVNTSESSGSTPRKSNYNRGNTLLKCSLLTSVVMLLEFALSLIFQNELGINISYPLVILFLTISQLLIFIVLKYSDFGKHSRKPASLSYLWSSVIIAIIIILIVLVVSFLLQINFYNLGDVMAKLVIPCFITLNIPLFAIIFYFSSNK